MTRKLKPVEVELDSEIQEAIRTLPVLLPDGSVATVGALISQAQESLRAANAAVSCNALVNTTASFLMKSEKRRGAPTIVMRLDGTAVLRIAYGEGDEPEAELAPPSRSKLPSLDTLRAEASLRGIDISDLGRKKTEIIQRLEGSGRG